MGEGAEGRCKVVFLREQALLQSYFSSQVTADQLIRNNVNETECCHECCTTRLARLRAARHEQVRTAKSRRRHRCRTLPRATRAARTSLTRHAGEVFYAAADTTHARRNVSTRADRPDVLIMGGSFYYNCHYATSDLDLNPRALHHVTSQPLARSLSSRPLTRSLSLSRASLARSRCHHVLARTLTLSSSEFTVAAETSDST